MDMKTDVDLSVEKSTEVIPEAGYLDFPLEMKWSFGHQSRIPILNLSTVDRKCIFFVSGPTGIIYEWEKNSQLLLQGHQNNISCTAVSYDKKWIATADIGLNSAFIIWDSITGTSLKAVSNYYPQHGAQYLEFSSDGETLVTLSSTNSPQELCLWKWMSKETSPSMAFNFKEEHGQQHFIVIHCKDSNHFITNSSTAVVFHQIIGNKIQHCAPPILEHDFKKAIGKFTQSAYVVANDLALTVTTLGNYLVWGNEKSAASYRKDTLFAHPNDRMLIRLLQPQTGRPVIRVLTVTENYTVSCNDKGVVYFYDEDLHVINAYKNIQKGPINGISFTYDPLFYIRKAFGHELVTVTTSSNPLGDFKCRDFIVSTVSGCCVYVGAEEEKITTVYRGTKFLVRAVATHPSGPFVCYGDYDGFLQLWNYDTKETMASHQIDEECKEIESIDFDPTGTYLVCGTTDGTLLMFDVPVLTETPAFKFRSSKHSVTICKFSPDSQYIATADSSHAISLYRMFCVKTRTKFDHRMQDTTDGRIQWDLLGRRRQHYKEIVDLKYDISTKNNHLHLLSLSTDRMLVIYDVTDSKKEDVQVLDMLCVEQTAIPYCMMWYPFYDDRRLIAIANDEYKLKIYDMKTQQCIKTVIQPLYDSPIRRMFLIEEPEQSSENEGENMKYLVFSTNSRLGLTMLPADGNPYKSSAIIAHHCGIHCVVASYDGKVLFSTGGEGGWINMWSIQTTSVRLSSKYGGDGMEPFLSILPGGKDGDTLNKLVDYFFYVQIKRYGENYMDPITISDEIPIEDISYIMAALGFYPTQYQQALLLNDAKFSTKVAAQNGSDKINLHEIIKLYINHRPALPLTFDKLKLALRKISGEQDEEPVVPRHHFIKIFEELGEPVSEEEMLSLVQCLKSRSRPVAAPVDEAPAKPSLQKELPPRISLPTMLNDILGYVYPDVPSVEIPGPAGKNK